MENLSSLVHELRERIAASSSTPPNIGDDDALKIRFRDVLPNLLHTYVVPSSSANEREVIAVLKQLTHTAKNFPGVFFHGRAAAVLPLIGRILPFFAEPTFRFIYLEDVLRFMLEDEALKTMSPLGGSPESEKISQSSLKNWAVNAFRERRALALTLDDTKTAVNKLRHMANVLVVIVIAVVSLIILGIATSRFLFLISS
ncbi:mechanosensitive ion channel protein 6-like [Camellia sinensis]|uniref:mechanosensitive ion channel protein 6-like n=1 Tax=Camellia sinensis TaxID=4442 RepID=UPI0010358A50|nr:mechanosensitive ion channel protein 6-like [Camellia sinensis]